MKPLLVLAALVFSFAATACTDANGARKALAGAGYSAITTGGYSLFGCSKGDTFATKFSAKGPTGQAVNGVVCSDWFKGTTIRTF